MNGVYLILAIIGIIILWEILKKAKIFYSVRYNYNIYEIKVLMALCVSSLLFLFERFGSYDYNLQRVFAVGALFCWILVFMYNVKRTSLIAGAIVTIIQSIISLGVVIFLLSLVSATKQAKREKNYPYSYQNRQRYPNRRR